MNSPTVATGSSWLTATSLIKTLARGRGTTYPDMPWEPKHAFGAVASFYAARLALPGHGFCAQFLGAMEQMEQVIRSSGQYGALSRYPAARIPRPDCWVSSAATHSGRAAEPGAPAHPFGLITRKSHEVTYC